VKIGRFNHIIIFIESSKGKLNNRINKGINNDRLMRASTITTACGIVGKYFLLSKNI